MAQAWDQQAAAIGAKTETRDELDDAIYWLEQEKKDRAMEEKLREAVRHTSQNKRHGAEEYDERVEKKQRVRGGQHVRLAKQLAYLDSQGQLDHRAMSASHKAYVAWSQTAHSTIWHKVTAKP